ncbi:MAG: hypothetical protein R2810_01575 [Flavobacteriales bacterium]
MANATLLYEEQLRIDPKLAFFILDRGHGRQRACRAGHHRAGLRQSHHRHRRHRGTPDEVSLWLLLNALVCGAPSWSTTSPSAAQPLSFTVSIALFTVIIFAAFSAPLSTPLRCRTA